MQPEGRRDEIVIVGAGVAGLATAIGCRRRGWPTRILERRVRDGRVGFGFLLLPNGCAALDALGLGAQMRAHGQVMRRLTVYPAGGDVHAPTMDIALPVDHYGLDRRFLIDLLARTAAGLGAQIDYGHTIQRFEFGDDGGVEAGVLHGGEQVEGRLWVGADGVASVLRRAMFPEAERRPLHIWELVSTTLDEGLARALHGRLIKWHDRRRGLAIGAMPLSPAEVIFYLQMDHARWVLPPPDPEGRQRYALDAFSHFAPLALRVIEGGRFASSHFYATGDLDPLPSAHRANAVLVGDAAHPFSPFTSQGVASALEDAVTLVQTLADGPDMGEAFSRYYTARTGVWQRRVLAGRSLSRQFRAKEEHAFEAPPIVQ